MCNIKDQIVTLLKQRHHSHKVALEQEKDPRSKHAIDLIARIREDSQLIELIDSLPEETCKDSLQVPETCKENMDSLTDDLDENNRKTRDAEVILNGHGLLVDVTKWADGYKLKVIVKEE